jgi:major membrane immunogen (membrane-anchored lipoprotein)
MPKKKSHAFNPVQIKDGWIVRLYKDGRIKSKIAPYETKVKPATKAV